VDVGGTKIQSAALRAKKVAGVHRLATPLTGAKDVAAAIGEAVAKALADGGAQPTDLKAVGMGVPGAIDTEAGTVSSSPNLPGFQEAQPVALGAMVSEALG
jgi:predicted NBD/HSP70 family sugar kinase